MLELTKSADKNLRRLASEGSRPRLPWGQRLVRFVQNPDHTAQILEALKFDQELYVRKSVANHLNDVAKNHPEWVIARLKKWKSEAAKSKGAGAGASRALASKRSELIAENIKNIDWIARHALRTLIKQGLPQALEVIGVTDANKILIRQFRFQPEVARIGGSLDFEFDLISEHSENQKLVIDYVIDFARRGERRSQKVFKLRTFTAASNSKTSLKKCHSLRVITTRRYHTGAHRLEIQVNGKILAGTEFEIA